MVLEPTVLPSLIAWWPGGLSAAQFCGAVIYFSMISNNCFLGVVVAEQQALDCHCFGYLSLGTLFSVLSLLVVVMALYFGESTRLQVHN